MCARQSVSTVVQCRPAARSVREASALELELPRVVVSTNVGAGD